jgi:hypothetical protein
MDYSNSFGDDAYFFIRLQDILNYCILKTKNSPICKIGGEPLKKWICLTLIIFFSWEQPVCSHQRVIPMTLHRALFVEGPENIQPSGLTIWNGQLYTVSDKHDYVIFKIELTRDVAILKPILPINIPTEAHLQRYDFEGITSDGVGNFYLVSETRFRILRVPSDGKEASWITPNLRPWGEKQHLFKVKNAYLEGISYITPGIFILCAERQPRGFMEVDIAGDSLLVRAYRSDRTRFEFSNHRSPDFTGLFWYQNSLYVLERNAYLISKLTKKNEQFEESFGWSFHHIITRNELKYSDMRYGKAEGFCLDDNYVYVIFDNNGMPRAARPNDRRPLLLIMVRPNH